MSHPLAEEEAEYEEDVQIGAHLQSGLAFVPQRPGQGSLMDELGDALRSEEGDSPRFSPHQPRVEPLGGNEVADGTNGAVRGDVGEYTDGLFCEFERKMGLQDEYNGTQAPERIFKVVLVGDSGVGKTCFLHRFCHNRFKATFSATIGKAVKSLVSSSPVSISYFMLT